MTEEKKKTKTTAESGGGKSKEFKKTAVKTSKKINQKTTASKTKEPKNGKSRPAVKEVKETSKVFAVLKTGGKQYKVKEGDILEIEKIEGKDEYDFGDVLLIVSEKEVKIGNPLITGAQIKAKILDEVKGKKVIVFKYKPKKRYRKKTGHRQKFTKVLIEKISL